MMDPKTYEFKPEDILKAELGDEFRDDSPRFFIGQVHDISGIKMRIRKITKKDLVLRPVRPKVTNEDGI